MFASIKRQKGKFLFSAVSRLLVFVLSFSLVFAPSAAQAQTIASLNLPVPGTMVGPSQAFVPVLLKGVTIHPNNPLQFDFIIDSGNTNFDQEKIKDESQRLVKYFLASMTIPKDDLWVNLSPYEKDRIIPDELGKTELGRDMLAQDYILKQLTASLMYPEKELGKAFWDKVYKQAKEKYGTTEIPVNTFNKVWILPETATVYEHGQTVYIVEAKLRVLLDSDYQAMNVDVGTGLKPVPTDHDLSVSTDIIREIILPAIEHEVNYGQNFAPLRQIYHSLILAKWYKETIKNSLLSKIYVDQKKIAGVNLDDATIKDQIYAQYMEAYKKGVFNYIKEDYDQLSQAPIPRKYFSGGEQLTQIPLAKTNNPVVGNGLEGKGYKATVVNTPQKDSSSSPILGGPWTLNGARKVLDVFEYHNFPKIIRAVEIVGGSHKKNSKDIERIKKVLMKNYFIKEESLEKIEKYLTHTQKFKVYLDLLKLGGATTAVSRLGKLGDPSAINPLLAELGYGGNGYGEHISTTEAVLKKLGATEDQLVDGYIAVLQSNVNTFAMWNAIGRLGALKSPKAINALLELVDGYYYKNAVAALRALGASERAIEPLIKLLNENTIPLEFREEVAILLKTLNITDDQLKIIDNRVRQIKSELVNINIHKLNSDGSMTAIEKLGVLRDPRSIEHLLHYLGEGGENYRHAERSLEKLGATKEQLVKAYTLVLREHYPYQGHITQNAIYKLGELGNPAPIKTLVGLLRRHDADEHKDVIVDTFKKLGGGSNEQLVEEMKQAENLRNYKGYNNLSYALYSLGDLRGSEFYFHVFVPGDWIETNPAEGYYEEVDPVEGPSMGEWYVHPGTTKWIQTKAANGFYIGRVDYWEKRSKIDKEKSSSPVSSDDKVGGIDMNSIDLEREGAGVDIQFDPAELQELIDAGIDGFAPVIINITPLPSVLPLLGLDPATKEEKFEVSSLN